MHKLFADAPRSIGVFPQQLGAAVLSRLGFQLADPHDRTLPFDLLASRDGPMRSWSKIQIKGASKDGSVSLRRGDKRAGCTRYVAGDFDYLLVVDAGAGVFLIPYHLVQRYRSRVCVRDIRFHPYRVAAALGDVCVSDALADHTPMAESNQLWLFPSRAA